MITSKDTMILAQSQIQRAIELCGLIGFPETVKTQQQKLVYITRTLTPFLMKEVVKNADKVLEEVNGI